MSTIKEIYKEYAQKDAGDLSGNQKARLKELLRNMQPQDLVTVDEHKMYIDILQKLRMANISDMMNVGDNFLATIKSMLAVGEDGLYSNQLRFIYELIQNVDDCDYETIEDCNLCVYFNYYTSPGQIVFSYNEKGFTPANVFALTGIAEKSKNVSADKMEIGEKGIGFKSVFGIADKVHVESGAFSFDLLRENFTVPIPRYENFTPLSGTRLTLQMETETVRKIYETLVAQYMQGDALLNKNPILFLNKLTALKVYSDIDHYIEFYVERKAPQIVNDVAFEDDIIVSVDMKDGTGNTYSNMISCRRYSQALLYGEKECKSRYGEQAPFIERRHNLIALFPEITDDIINFKTKGLLYSFLPTQIQTTAPIVLHVPFKLDGSREFVDSQKGNRWFNFTTRSLNTFLKKVYLHLATVIKQDVIYYIPSKHKYFFKKTNEKVECLLLKELQGDIIYREKVFCAIDGSFNDCNNVIAFDKEEIVENPQRAHELMRIEKKLFVPRSAISMQWYGVKTIDHVLEQLFVIGLKNPEIFEEIIRMLDCVEKKIDFGKLISYNLPLELTEAQVKVISRYKDINDALFKCANENVKRGELPLISLNGTWNETTSKVSDLIVDLLDDADVNEAFIKYMHAIEYKCFTVNGVGQEFVLPTRSGILLAREAPLESLCSIVRYHDPHKTFTAILRIRAASERLNKNDDSEMSDEEYMSQLRAVRRYIINAYGQNVYKNYVKIINQAGTDKNRFLGELLQNADDCSYASGTPRFTLRSQGTHQIRVSYNETGFTKQNVRAITAIGESTKKLLLNGNGSSIGEKGVGFKSVFGVASRVEIHSNNFDFELSADEPTVPNKCKRAEGNENIGTTMIFDMKQDIRAILKSEKVLELCLCLRKLKQITIQDINIRIEDTDTKRIVSMGNKKYQFERFNYRFKIKDLVALEERGDGQRKYSEEQEIVCYLPEDYKAEKYALYVGLPTQVKCLIPMVIDAPFELTTSRDDIIQCR